MLRTARRPATAVILAAYAVLAGCGGDDANSSAAAGAGGLGVAGAGGSRSGDAQAGSGGASGSAGQGGAGGNAAGSGGASGAGAGAAAGAGGGTGDSGANEGGTPDAGSSGRPFPDTTSTIAILADQLPNLNAAQQNFVVQHFVGTEKQTLAQSQLLRALSPNFLVLHYHLSMWQSAPGTDYIIDGKSWGNDYDTVNAHEAWFWHNPAQQRIASNVDHKILMNLADADFTAYAASSLIAQVAAGDYDGVFYDSASPALLQGEVGDQDARLAGTGAKDSIIAELGNKNFITAWQTWIQAVSGALAQHGIPLLPNTSAFVTGWDNTDYGLTDGAFVEGFADPSWATSDWKASTNELLALGAKHKILILQNYLAGADDVSKRMYYLGNYLLAKADRTYLDYFAAGPLEWYPEWGLDLGAPMKTGTTVEDLSASGVYRRDFANGVVLVNPSDSAVNVSLGATLQRVTPQGGGAVDTGGAEPGTITKAAVTAVNVAAKSAEILLR